MEGFTQDMFNNIIGFQERDHAAWNTDLTFSQRISKLPLHYLIFSNADRNPETHGPTIAHFYPLRWEMQTLAKYAKQVAKKPVIFDLYARNGFVGSLLAREGVKVVGWKNALLKPNQIESFYDEQNYEMRDNPPEASEQADVVFANWTPSGVDDTQHILSLKPKMIVYIYTQHINEHSEERQTGTEDSFGKTLPDNYALVDEWQVTRPENVLHEVWPDLTANIEETRTVRVFALKDFDPALFMRLEAPKGKCYDWESELNMAETAMEAKQYLKKHGFPSGSF